MGRRRAVDATGQRLTQTERHKNAKNDRKTMEAYAENIWDMVESGKNRRLRLSCERLYGLIPSRATVRDNTQPEESTSAVPAVRPTTEEAVAAAEAVDEFTDVTQTSSQPAVSHNVQGDSTGQAEEEQTENKKKLRYDDAAPESSEKTENEVEDPANISVEHPHASWTDTEVAGSDLKTDNVGGNIDIDGGTNSVPAQNNSPETIGPQVGEGIIPEAQLQPQESVNPLYNNAEKQAGSETKKNHNDPNGKCATSPNKEHLADQLVGTPGIICFTNSSETCIKMDNMGTTLPGPDLEPEASRKLEASIICSSEVTSAEQSKSLTKAKTPSDLGDFVGLSTEARSLSNADNIMKEDSDNGNPRWESSTLCRKDESDNNVTLLHVKDSQKQTPTLDLPLDRENEHSTQIDKPLSSPALVKAILQSASPAREDNSLNKNTREHRGKRHKGKIGQENGSDILSSRGDTKLESICLEQDSQALTSDPSPTETEGPGPPESPIVVHPASTSSGRPSTAGVMDKASVEKKGETADIKRKKRKRRKSERNSESEQNVCHSKLDENSLVCTSNANGQDLVEDIPIDHEENVEVVWTTVESKKTRKNRKRSGRKSESEQQLQNVTSDADNEPATQMSGVAEVSSEELLMSERSMQDTHEEKNTAESPGHLEHVLKEQTTFDAFDILLSAGDDLAEGFKDAFDADMDKLDEEIKSPKVHADKPSVNLSADKHPQEPSDPIQNQHPYHEDSLTEEGASVQIPGDLATYVTTLESKEHQLQLKEQPENEPMTTLPDREGETRTTLLEHDERVSEITACSSDDTTKIKTASIAEHGRDRNTKPELLHLNDKVSVFANDDGLEQAFRDSFEEEDCRKTTAPKTDDDVSSISAIIIRTDVSCSENVASAHELSEQQTEMSAIALASSNNNINHVTNAESVLEKEGDGADTDKHDTPAGFDAFDLLMSGGEGLAEGFSESFAEKHEVPPDRLLVSVTDTERISQSTNDAQKSPWPVYSRDVVPQEPECERQPRNASEEENKRSNAEESNNQKLVSRNEGDERKETGILSEDYDAFDLLMSNGEGLEEGFRDAFMENAATDKISLSETDLKISDKPPSDAETQEAHLSVESATEAAHGAVNHTKPSAEPLQKSLNILPCDSHNDDTATATEANNHRVETKDHQLTENIKDILDVAHGKDSNAGLEDDLGYDNNTCNEAGQETGKSEQLDAFELLMSNVDGPEQKFRDAFSEDNSKDSILGEPKEHVSEYVSKKQGKEITCPGLSPPENISGLKLVESPDDSAFDKNTFETTTVTPLPKTKDTQSDEIPPEEESDGKNVDKSHQAIRNHFWYDKTLFDQAEAQFYKQIAREEYIHKDHVEVESDSPCSPSLSVVDSSLSVSVFNSSPSEPDSSSSSSVSVSVSPSSASICGSTQSHEHPASPNVHGSSTGFWFEKSVHEQAETQYHEHLARVQKSETKPCALPSPGKQNNASSSTHVSTVSTDSISWPTPSATGTSERNSWFDKSLYDTAETRYHERLSRQSKSPEVARKLSGGSRSSSQGMYDASCEHFETDDGEAAVEDDVTLCDDYIPEKEVWTENKVYTFVDGSPCASGNPPTTVSIAPPAPTLTKQIAVDTDPVTSTPTSSSKVTSASSAYMDANQLSPTTTDGTRSRRSTFNSALSPQSPPLELDDQYFEDVVLAGRQSEVTMAALRGFTASPLSEGLAPGEQLDSLQTEPDLELSEPGTADILDDENGNGPFSYDSITSGGSSGTGSRTPVVDGAQSLSITSPSLEVEVPLMTLDTEVALHQLTEKITSTELDSDAVETKLTGEITSIGNGIMSKVQDIGQEKSADKLLDTKEDKTSQKITDKENATSDGADSAVLDGKLFSTKASRVGSDPGMAKEVSKTAPDAESRVAVLNSDSILPKITEKTAAAADTEAPVTSSNISNHTTAPDTTASSPQQMGSFPSPDLTTNISPWVEVKRMPSPELETEVKSPQLAARIPSPELRSELTSSLEVERLPSPELEADMPAVTLPTELPSPTLSSGIAVPTLEADLPTPSMTAEIPHMTLSSRSPSPTNGQHILPSNTSKIPLDVCQAPKNRPCSEKADTNEVLDEHNAGEELQHAKDENKSQPIGPHHLLEIDVNNQTSVTGDDQYSPKTFDDDINSFACQKAPRSPIVTKKLNRKKRSKYTGSKTTGLEEKNLPSKENISSDFSLNIDICKSGSESTLCASPTSKSPSIDSAETLSPPLANETSSIKTDTNSHRPQSHIKGVEIGDKMDEVISPTSQREPSQKKADNTSKLDKKTQPVIENKSEIEAASKAKQPAPATPGSDVPVTASARPSAVSRPILADRTLFLPEDAGRTYASLLQQGGDMLPARPVFTAHACHVCKRVHTKQHRLKSCGSCRLVAYCSPEHQRAHWPLHRALCKVVTRRLRHLGTDHLYREALNVSSAEQWKKIRFKHMAVCEEMLDRPMEAYEKEMFLYPRACDTCHETAPERLHTCTVCHSISYCREDHLRKSHAKFCKDLRLLLDIHTYQNQHGVCDPVLPETQLTEYEHLPPHIREFLVVSLLGPQKAFQMGAVELAVLTEYASYPLTMLYALQNIPVSAEAHISQLTSLTVHVVGAEFSTECDPITRWDAFLLSVLPRLRRLHVVFVGLELEIGGRPGVSAEDFTCAAGRAAGKRFTCEFQPNTAYHSYCRSPQYKPPQVICAFNAGLYKYAGHESRDTWKPSLPYLVQEGVPLILTGYNLLECPQDVARIQQEQKVDVLLPPMKNPYRSTRPQQNFLNEHEAPLVFKNQYVACLMAASRPRK